MTDEPCKRGDEVVPPVIFIRGIMPRSGTNFLADALDRHTTIVRSPGQFWEYVPFRFQSLLQHYVDQVASSKHAHQFAAQRFLPRVGEAWMRYLAGDLPGGKVALFKEPSVDGLESMFRMYDQSRSIIILRDGRDIVSSALNSDFAFPPFRWTNPSHLRRLLPDEEFRILCRQFRNAAQLLLNFLGSDAGKEFAERFMIVKYEDLVENPVEHLTRIMQWANLDPAGFDWESFDKMPIRGSSFLRNAEGQHDFGSGVERPAGGF
ncbi:MAG: sulfotransferase, partial [Planctomycetales bacterium]|nr:sulfotransferase [Planctomycetales bacterium]